jgi:hypothetical protein
MTFAEIIETLAAADAGGSGGKAPAVRYLSPKPGASRSFAGIDALRA